MKEECEEQTDLAAWVNKSGAYRYLPGYEEFEKFTFQTPEEKMAYVYNLCESGYRIL